MLTESKTTVMVERLKEEIDRLVQEHGNAMESAVYLGMTSDEVRRGEARRKKLKELINELAFCSQQKPHPTA